MWRAVFSQAMEISSLSDEDYVRIIANYNDASGGQKNKVSSDASSRGYSAEQLALVTDRISERYEPIVSCGLRFTKPFGHIKYDLLGYTLVLFDNYERGSLPFQGTTSEQPAQIMEIFAVLRQLKHEAELKANQSASSNTRSSRQ